jgi:hypothetical protein
MPTISRRRGLHAAVSASTPARCGFVALRGGDPPARVTHEKCVSVPPASSTIWRMRVACGSSCRPVSTMPTECSFPVVQLVQGYGELEDHIVRVRRGSGGEDRPLFSGDRKQLSWWRLEPAGPRAVPCGAARHGRGRDRDHARASGRGGGEDARLRSVAARSERFGMNNVRMMHCMSSFRKCGSGTNLSTLTLKTT